MALPAGTQFLVLAPLVKAQKGEYRDLFEDLQKQGFARARVDGRVVPLSDDLQLDRQMRHYIEVVIDRLAAGSAIRPRLAEAVELTLRLGEGNLIVAVEPDGKQPRFSKPPPEPDAEEAADPPPEKRRSKSRGKASAEIDDPRGSDLILSAHYACTHCGISFESPSPQLFSFNSPQGMCQKCDGLGEIYGFDVARLVPDPRRTFKDGCFELIGPWREMGRWRRHIFAGVGASIERLRDPASRHAAGNAAAECSSTSCKTCCSGEPASSIFRTPGAPARMAINTAENSRGSCRSFCRAYPKTSKSRIPRPAVGKIHEGVVRCRHAAERDSIRKPDR